MVVTYGVFMTCFETTALMIEVIFAASFNGIHPILIDALDVI